MKGCPGRRGRRWQQGRSFTADAFMDGRSASAPCAGSLLLLGSVASVSEPSARARAASLDPGAFVQMPYLVEQDAAAASLIVLPSLRINGQSYPLQPGVHGLGGRA